MAGDSLWNAPVACQPLLDAAEQGNITLLYSAHDTKHNNAIALKSYLDEQLTGKKVEDS